MKPSELAGVVTAFGGVSILIIFLLIFSASETDLRKFKTETASEFREVSSNIDKVSRQVSDIEYTESRNNSYQKSDIERLEGTVEHQQDHIRLLEKRIRELEIHRHD